MIPRLVAVMGPTASGKTEAAERVAEAWDAALLNADAFQVYRGMDIGTAKPEDRSRYRLLDLRDPDEGLTVGAWVRLARAELDRLWAEGRSAVIVGGTGLYIRALLEGYDDLGEPAPPEVRLALTTRMQVEGVDALAEELRREDPAAWARVDRKNPVRVQRALERARYPAPPTPPEPLPPFAVAKFAIDPGVERGDEAIRSRVRRMVYDGWVLEVQRLAERGYGPGDPGFRAHGYVAMHGVLRGEVGLEEAMDRTVVEVRRYAKRQRTWLRSEPNLIRSGSSTEATKLLLASS